MTVTSTLPHAGMPPWPARLQPVFERFRTTEFATLSRIGTPITWPVTPYVGDGTLDVTCGLANPSKAERARNDPRVALLFSWPVGSGMERADTVLVQGLATVRDADLQANVDRFLEVAFAKAPDVYAGVPAVVLQRLMGWYWPRIWIHVTPLRVSWWPGGDLDATPRTWTAPSGTSATPSDAAPRGPAPGRRGAEPADVAGLLDRAVTLSPPVVTTTDAAGWPLPLRALELRRLGPTTADLLLPAGVTVAPGPVCLTFHDHDGRRDRQDNVVLLGMAAPRDGTRSICVEVDRALPGVRRPRSRVGRTVLLLTSRRALRPRVAREAVRRGQALPAIRIPRGVRRTANRDLHETKEDVR